MGGKLMGGKQIQGDKKSHITFRQVVMKEQLLFLLLLSEIFNTAAGQPRVETILRHQ